MKYEFDDFVVAKVFVDGARSLAVFTSKNNKAFIVELYQDCCETVYFEDFSAQTLKNMVGQTIVSVEDVSSTKWTSYSAVSNQWVSYGALKFTTNCGETIVDWRCDSNGRHDGHCMVSETFEVIKEKS